MSGRASKRRSVRQLAGRKRSVYFEPDTDDDFALERGSDEAVDIHLQLEPQQAQPLRKRKKFNRRPTKRETRSKTQNRSLSTKRSARPQKKNPIPRVGTTLGKKRKHKGLKQVGFTGPSDGRVPAWTSLPLDVLRDIFIFASQPRHEQTTTARFDASLTL